MVVCSLARVKIVRSARSAPPSPVQSSGPAAVSFFFFSLFLSVAKPREPRQFFPPVGIRRSLHVFHVALSVCSACLGESPPGSPFLLFISLLSSVANQASESCFSRRILPESEVGAVHPFSKIRELWFVPVSQALVLLSCSKYLLSFPDFCCMSFQTLRSVS